MQNANWSVVGVMVLLILVVLSTPAGAVWVDSSSMYRTPTNVTEGVQSVNISNVVGTNNASFIFCNGHCAPNFTDIRFVQNNVTYLPYWIEDNTSSIIRAWVNATGSGPVDMYYGNLSYTSTANGTTTFSAFSDLCNLNGFTELGTGSITNCVYTSAAVAGHYYGVFWNTSFGTNYAFGARVKTDSSWSHPGWTDEIKDESYTATTDMAVAQIASAGVQYWQTRKLGVLSEVAVSYSNTEFFNLEVIRNASTSVIYKIDGTTLRTETTQVPTVNLYPNAKAYATDGAFQLDWMYVRKHDPALSQWASWGSEQNRLVSGYGNNYTGDSTLDIDLLESEHINFYVTKTYSSDTVSWYFNGVNQSSGNSSINLTISQVGVNNVTAYIMNGTDIVSVSWSLTLPFLLLTPVNGSSQSFTYPPMTTPVTFSWNSVGTSYYELMVSQTSGFTIIVSDTYVSATSSNISLSEGDYWWKVRDYNSTTGVYGPWSDVSNFTLSKTQSLSGTNIQGTTFELIASGNSVVSGATVCAYNNLTTWSSCQVVGSNGYYLFSGLVNSSTYHIYSSKVGYDTTAALPVTVINGSTVTHDIQMRLTVNPYIPDYVFATFHLRYTNWTAISGSDVSVYRYGEALTYDTGTTGDQGEVVFQLNKVQKYTVVFEDSSGTVLATWIGYPSENVPVTVYVPVASHTAITPPSNRTWYNTSYSTSNWSLANLTSGNLTSQYGLGLKAQGIIMGLIALFMIPYGGVVAMVGIAFLFAILGLITFQFVFVYGVVSAAWYFIKKEFT